MHKTFMSGVRHWVVLTGIALSVGASLAAQAQTDTAADSAAPGVSLTDGEVKRVDRDAGKLTIKHGPIRNLDMPPMTMVFVARDMANLASLKAGDKIRFVASNESGKYFASDIQPAP